MMKTKLKSKIGLIVLGIFLALIILELGLSSTGFVLYSLQRDRVEITGENNEYRILSIGESTTANLWNGESSWPEELERILNNRSSRFTSDSDTFKVFNEGISGTTSIHILRNLEDNLRKYNPDMVIVMMGINDLEYWDYIDKREGITNKKNEVYGQLKELKVVLCHIVFILN